MDEESAVSGSRAEGSPVRPRQRSVRNDKAMDGQVIAHGARPADVRFRVMADSAPVLIWMSDMNKLRTYCNQRWLDFTGRTLEQEQGNGWAEGVHPEDRERCQALYAAAFDARQEFSMDYRLRRHDGEYRWIQDNGVPLFDLDNVFTGYIGSCVDITERKRAEADLREREIFFRTLTTLAPSMIWTAAPDGTITYANDQWFAYFGITPEENALGWPELVLHPDDQERSMVAWTHALQTGEDYEIEVRNRRYDGEYRWFLTRATALRDDEGRISAWFGVTIDIHERSQLERDVAERASVLEAVFAAAPGHISIFDESGKLARLNPAAQRVAGPEREQASMETVGQTFHLRTVEGAPFPPDELPVARALRGEIVQGVEMILRDAEQCDQYILTSSAPFYDLTGQLRGAVALAHDVTALREAERESAKWAAQLDATIDAFTDGLFIYDSAGQLTRMNDAARTILALDAAPDYYSLTPEERTARLQVRDATDQPLAPEEWGLGGLAQGERLAVPVELRITALDGCAKDLAITGGPVRNPQGVMTGAVALLRDVTDRRRLERAAMEHASQLQATFNALAEPMCVFDADGRILRQNMAELLLFGFATSLATIEERAVRIELRDVEGHRLPMERLPARKVLAGATLVGIDAVEVVARGADGHDRRFSVGGAPIRDDAGQIIGGVTVYRDVTERRSLERQVTEQVERLQTIFETIADAIFLFDAQGQIVDANPAGRRQLPNDIADFNARLQQERNVSYVLRDAHGAPMDPADWPVTRLLRGETLTGEAIVDMVAVLPDGRERWLSVSGAPIRDQVGQIIGAVGMTRDITERRRLEQQTRWQASLLERAHDAIFMWELDGPIAYWNLGAELLYGYSRDEAVGQISHQLLQTKRPVSPTAFKEALERDGEWIGEIGHTTRDGRRLVVESRHQLLTESDGRHYVLETCRDITERLELERELRRSRDELEQRVRERTRALATANRTLRRLSQRILDVQESERRRIARELHDEIGQALIGVKMMFETASTENGSRRATTAGGGQVSTSVREAIDEALLRVRELSLDLRPAMLDNLGLLPTLLWRFERFTQQTGIRVEFHHTGLDQRFSPEIETGAYRIVQEALTNAARHASVDVVTVQMMATAETLTIYIIDQGAGFDADEALAAGVSTGLSGMYERAGLLEGTLTVTSAPGEGTTIEVLLPLAPAMEIENVRDSAREATRDGRGEAVRDTARDSVQDQTDQGHVR